MSSGAWGSAALGTQRRWEGGASSLRAHAAGEPRLRSGPDYCAYLGATTTGSGPGTPAFRVGRLVAQCRRARLFRWEGGSHSQRGSWALGSGRRCPGLC